MKITSKPSGPIGLRVDALSRYRGQIAQKKRLEEEIAQTRDRKAVTEQRQQFEFLIELAQANLSNLLSPANDGCGFAKFMKDIIARHGPIHSIECASVFGFKVRQKQLVFPKGVDPSKITKGQPTKVAIKDEPIKKGMLESESVKVIDLWEEPRTTPHNPHSEFVMDGPGECDERVTISIAFPSRLFAPKSDDANQARLIRIGIVEREYEQSTNTTSYDDLPNQLVSPEALDVLVRLCIPDLTLLFFAEKFAH